MCDKALRLAVRFLAKLVYRMLIHSDTKVTEEELIQIKGLMRGNFALFGDIRPY